MMFWDIWIFTNPYNPYVSVFDDPLRHWINDPPEMMFRATLREVWHPMALVISGAGGSVCEAFWAKKMKCECEVLQQFILVGGLEHVYLGVSINGGTQKWMVFVNGKNPIVRNG